MRLIKKSRLIAIRASKRPFAMPEKFAFEQCFRDGRAIHRDKRLLFSGADLVNRPCNQFFPRAGFADNQRIHVSRRRAHGQFIHPLHRLTFADQFAEAIPFGEGGFKGRIFFSKTLALLFQPQFPELAFMHILNGQQHGGLSVPENRRMFQFNPQRPAVAPQLFLPFERRFLLRF